MWPQPGSPAPDFCVESVKADGEVSKVRLTDYRGKYLAILFFPVSFGHVTVTEFHELEELKDSFRQLDCRLLAVSTEHTSRYQRSLAVMGIVNSKFN
jgi:alkyl hydroperoxide reductase subunit AhpC